MCPFLRINVLTMMFVCLCVAAVTTTINTPYSPKFTAFTTAECSADHATITATIKSSLVVPYCETNFSTNQSDKV